MHTKIYVLHMFSINVIHIFEPQLQIYGNFNFLIIEGHD